MWTKPSDARRRDLGAELRRWREAAGLNGLQLSRKIGWDPSTVSRLESGQGAVTETIVMIYLAHCGVSAADAERVLRLAQETEDGYLVRRDVLRTLILHEATADSIQMTAPLLVPGLLQTDDYTRAMLELHGLTEPAEIESGLSVRTSRRDLLKRWQPPRVTCLLYESALRCPFGGNQVMNEQMLHLAFLSDRPNMNVRIVPTSTGSLLATAGQMMLMDFTTHGPVLYLESAFAGLFAEQKDDIEHCREILRKLGRVALSEGHSRELLVQLASDYDRPDEESRDARLAQEQL